MTPIVVFRTGEYRYLLVKKSIPLKHADRGRHLMVEEIDSSRKGRTSGFEHVAYRPNGPLCALKGGISRASGGVLAAMSDVRPGGRLCLALMHVGGGRTEALPGFFDFGTCC